MHHRTIGRLPCAMIRSHQRRRCPMLGDPHLEADLRSPFDPKETRTGSKSHSAAAFSLNVMC